MDAALAVTPSVPDLQLSLRHRVAALLLLDELHTINQPVHRYEIYERNLDWFRFWLQGEQDPDPAKAEQYKRWRELRKMQELQVVSKPN